MARNVVAKAAYVARSTETLTPPFGVTERHELLSVHRAPTGPEELPNNPAAQGFPSALNLVGQEHPIRLGGAQPQDDGSGRTGPVNQVRGNGAGVCAATPSVFADFLHTRF